MRARLRSWRKQIKQHRTPILVVAIILVIAIALIIVGYKFDWTGFNGNNKSGKTLWDWLQLLIIPAVLAVGGYVINLTISRSEQAATEQRAKSEREAAERRAETEREIAQDNQREAALQTYIDKMSELLFKENLRESQPDDEVRIIARVLTLAVLRGLDANRKGNLLQFLYEAHLINKDVRDGILNLEGANLSDINLCSVYLRGAKLSKTNLSRAKLIHASLREVDLSYADLAHTDLSYADLSQAYLRSTNLSSANLYETDLLRANLRNASLSHANLSYANLDEADLYNADLGASNMSKALVITEQLNQAKSLQGATMPDGSIHP